MGETNQADIYNYISSVSALENGVATRRELVEAITQWQMAVNSDYEGHEMSFPMAQRTVWLFPNNFTFIISSSSAPNISILNEMISWDSAAPVPEAQQDDWHPESFVNGWRLKNEPFEFRDTDFILETLDALIEVNGTPKLIIPWRDSWGESAIGEEEEYYTDWQPPRDINPLRKAIQDMFKAVANGLLEKQSPWEVEFTHEEAYLSDECSYIHFKRFLDEIENRKMAIVVRNVWTDFMRNEDDFARVRKEHPNSPADMPIVWVPKNWAINTYRPNGWVYGAVIYVDQPELEKQMYILADEMELSLYPRWAPEEVEDEEWEAEGIFKIQSDID